MKSFATALVLAWVSTLLNAGIVEAQAAAAQPWTLSVGVGSFYDASFAADVEQRADFGGTLLANLGRSLNFGPRGSLNLSGNVSQDFYDLRHVSYGVAVSGSYLITQRLSWTITDAVNSSLGQYDEVLTDAGLVLPNVETLTHSLSTGFGYLLSPRSDVHVAFASQTAGFDSSILIGGLNFSATVGLGRRLTASQSLQLNHQYQRTYTDTGGVGTIQSLAASWQLTKGRASLSAKGGLGAFTEPDRDNYDFTPVSSLDWSVRFNRTHSIALGYSNTVEQAFGYNFNQVTQMVAATYTLTYGLATLGFNVSYSQSSSPVVDDRLRLSGPGNFSVQFTLRPNLTLGVASSVYASRETPAPSGWGYRVGTTLSYSKGFR